jgi:hypothetical protein
MNPCTLWYRHSPVGGWEFNHLDDEHQTTEKPPPKHANHDSWLRSRWQRKHAWLTDEVPPKVVYYSDADL